MEFEEVLRNVALTCARFLAFSAHAFLFGAPVVTLTVLRPAFASLDIDAWETGRARLAQRFEGMVQAAFVASAAATGVAILLQAVLVAGLNEGELSSPSFMSVFSTAFGRWHLLRYPLLGALVVLLFGKVRQWSFKLPGEASPLWWLAWVVMALALLSTHSFSGHAAVAMPRGWGLLNDVVHLSFASVWFAGIVILAVLLPDAWHHMDEVQRLRLLGPVVRRFSNVALASIVIVAITGALNSLMNVGKLADMLESAYGVSLTIKLLFFLGILGLGGINHFILRDRLQVGTAGPRSGSAQSFFRVTIAIELVIAVTIMGITGWLVGQAKTRQDAIPGDAPAIEQRR